MKKWTLTCSLLTSLVWGEDIKGIVLVDDAAKLGTEEVRDVQGVHLDGVAGDAAAWQETLQPFLGEGEWTKEREEALEELVAMHYLTLEGQTAEVSFQKVEGGVAEFVVSPSPIAPIAVPAAPAPVVEETKKSWKVSLGTDNTGNQLLGPVRMYTEGKIGDLISLGDSATVQVKVGQKVKEYQSYKGTYTIPFGEQQVALTGQYSATTPHTSAFPQKHRFSYEATGRYSVPVYEGGWIGVCKLEAGADFKGSNTNLFDEGNPTPTQKMLAYIGQFVGGLKVEQKVGDASFKGALLGVGSPGEMLPNQTAADFTNLRANATPTYAYLKPSLSWDQKLPMGWNVALKGAGQFSFSVLMPSEQYALGGITTVRGYEERIVNGDHGFCTNVEITTPSTSVVGLWMPKVTDALSLLGFVDAGSAWFREEVANTALHQSLLGLGAGLRYDIGEYLKAKMDVAFPMLDVEKDGGSMKIHFSVATSY